MMAGQGEVTIDHLPPGPGGGPPLFLIRAQGWAHFVFTEHDYLSAWPLPKWLGWVQARRQDFTDPECLAHWGRRTRGRR